MMALSWVVLWAFWRDVQWASQMGFEKVYELERGRVSLVEMLENSYL
jgi:hypothetical protein